MVFPEPMVQVDEFNKHAGLKKSTLLWIASLTEMVNASFQFPSTHQLGGMGDTFVEKRQRLAFWVDQKTRDGQIGDHIFYTWE